MAYLNGPQIVRDGLVLCLDAGNTKSYAGSGTAWADMSGNNNSGSLTNGPTFSGNNGGSISFDGVNDYVNTNFTNNIVTGGFTFNFWFYGTKSTVHFPAQFFVNDDINTIFRIERFSAGNDTIEFGHSPNGGSIASNELISFNFPNNVWHYCSLVYDGNYKYIYKNGFIDTTSASGQTLTYYSGAFLRIGARQDSSLLPFAGNIPQVSIYNRALSANEILQNYNATRQRYGA
jgi:hypothetical protein